MSATASFSKSDRQMICDCSVETNGGLQTQKKLHLFPMNLPIAVVI
jgi:hypothetical protein